MDKRIFKRLIRNRRKLINRRNLSNVIGRTFYYMGLSRKLKSNTPVFVYQMGKVASSSVYKSLKNQYQGVVFYAHSFGGDHLHYGIRKLYRYYKGKNKLKVITLVREPIGRNISAFFENFQMYTGTSYKQGSFSIEYLKKIFLKSYNHDIALDWFDENIKKHFGIDVFEMESPYEGYQITQNENVELLIMRHDLDDWQKEKLVKEFVGIDQFTLNNYNIARDKKYASTYRAFKKQVKLPDEYLSKMGSSRYFNHFYRKSEIDLALEKWTEKQVNNIS